MTGIEPDPGHLTLSWSTNVVGFVAAQVIVHYLTKAAMFLGMFLILFFGAVLHERENALQRRYAFGASV